MTPASGTSADDDTGDSGPDLDAPDLSAPGRPAGFARPASRPSFRRRRVVAVLALVAVIVAVGLGVRALVAEDDATDPPEAPVIVELRDASAVLAELREGPCALLVAQEVEGVVQRTFANPEEAGGVCTYALDDGGVGLVSVQAFGPLSQDAFDALVADGVDLEGTRPSARWIEEGAGGRALALDGGVTVEVAVRLDVGSERLRAIAADLIDLATSRVEDNEQRDPPSPAGEVVGDCTFLTDEAAPLLDGAELQPMTNPDVCSYRRSDGFVTIERIPEPSVGLDDIRRSSGAAGDEEEWPREEVDVADGGVWLVPPGEGQTSGELYALDGDVMVHVSISGPDLDAARQQAIDLVGTVAK